MQRFTDRTGHEWSLAIDFSTALALKQSPLAFDIQIALDPEQPQFRSLMTDIYWRGQLLWMLCEEQAVALAITPEAFARRFDGEVMDQALQALVLEIIDFFPLAKRSALRAVLDKVRLLEAGLVAEAVKKIDAINIDDEVATLLRGSRLGSNSPALSGSPPGDSPSVV